MRRKINIIFKIQSNRKINWQKKIPVVDLAVKRIKDTWHCSVKVCSAILRSGVAIEAHFARRVHAQAPKPSTARTAKRFKRRKRPFLSFPPQSRVIPTLFFVFLFVFYASKRCIIRAQSPSETIQHASDGDKAERARVNITLTRQKPRRLVRFGRSQTHRRRRRPTNEIEPFWKRPVVGFGWGKEQNVYDGVAACERRNETYRSISNVMNSRPGRFVTPVRFEDDRHRESRRHTLKTVQTRARAIDIRRRDESSRLWRNDRRQNTVWM